MPPIRHEKRGNKVHHKTPMAHPHHHSENKASPQGKVVGPADETNRLRDLALIIKDFRKNLTCGICIRPLYEPYTNPCGHTFCYRCVYCHLVICMYKRDADSLKVVSTIGFPPLRLRKSVELAPAAVLL